jgi:hypothetical protein
VVVGEAEEEEGVKESESVYQCKRVNVNTCISEVGAMIHEGCRGEREGKGHPPLRASTANYVHMMDGFQSRPPSIDLSRTI